MEAFFVLMAMIVVLAFIEGIACIEDAKDMKKNTKKRRKRKE